MVKTRHRFDIVGKIVNKDSIDTLHFKVKSTTSINCVIASLCEQTQKECSQIKNIFIWCKNMTWSERYNISSFDLEKQWSFRDLSLVGKKSIVVIVKFS